jgi:hypothetical protein
MSGYASGDLPYVCGSPPRNRRDREDMTRYSYGVRAPFRAQAEAEGFEPGTREHGHRTSRLAGSKYDCGCAGCCQTPIPGGAR